MFVVLWNHLTVEIDFSGEEEKKKKYKKKRKREMETETETQFAFVNFFFGANEKKLESAGNCRNVL